MLPIQLLLIGLLVKPFFAPWGAPPHKFLKLFPILPELTEQHMGVLNFASLQKKSVPVLPISGPRAATSFPDLESVAPQTALLFPAAGQNAPKTWPGHKPIIRMRIPNMCDREPLEFITGSVNGCAGSETDTLEVEGVL